jgi:DNA gyrase subunit A
MTLFQVLKEYIIHRQLVITRRSQADYKKPGDRAHILEGLLIALANLDEVIATIRNSSDTEAAHQALNEKIWPECSTSNGYFRDATQTLGRSRTPENRR